MPQQPGTYIAYGFSGGPGLLSNTVVLIAATPIALQSVTTSKNTNGNDCYLLLFNANKTSMVTLGTTIPLKIIPILASTNFNVPFDMSPIFSLGLCAAMVMTSPTGSTAPTTPFGVDIGYQ